MTSSVPAPIRLRRRSRQTRSIPYSTFALGTRTSLKGEQRRVRGVHAELLEPLLADDPGRVHVHVFGTEEQKQRYLVPSIKGEKIACFGITEARRRV